MTYLVSEPLPVRVTGGVRRTYVYFTTYTYTYSKVEDQGLFLHCLSTLSINHYTCERCTQINKKEQPQTTFTPRSWVN